MTRRLSLAALAASVAAMGVAYGSAFFPGPPPAWAAWVASAAIPGSLVAAMALGAGGRHGLGRLVLPFAFVFVVLAGGFMAALALPPASGSSAELWLGFPPGAAVVLYGVGLLPLFVVPISYALTFDELTLSDEDWARVRAAAERTAAEGAAGERAAERGAADRGRTESPGESR